MNDQNRIEEVEQISSDGRTARRVQTVDNGGADRVSGQTVAARVIWYIAGLILGLLALRFILALLGANKDNGFANFIFSVSHPFVAPFFTLFNSDYSYGSSHVETYTLVAIAVYAVVAYAIAKLFTLNRRAA
ncbi:MAG: YggT family protein [Patescibacteria group bacterium]|nr:YggT family protein [Patescibacteria group bacterium]